MKYKVAAIQTETGASKEENIERALHQLDLAAREGVRLACLHEYLTTECPESDNTKEEIRKVAESIPGPTIELFAKKAKEHQIYIVVGTILELDQDKLYNTAVFINSDGRIVGKYRKMHPENNVAKYEISSEIVPGDEYPVFDTEIGKIGIMIDMDGSVPAVAEILSLKGAEVICWPLNWSVRWALTVRTLSSALGGSSNCHILVANRVGPRSKESQFSHLSYDGGSRIIDPEGNVIAKAPDFYEGMAVATINLEFTKKWRNEIIPRDYPLRRRPETYGVIIQS